jgi:hypothetical protein
LEISVQKMGPLRIDTLLQLSGKAESGKVVSGDYNINPRYVSIFAIQGWANNAGIIPAYFDSFMSAGISCSK